jgi:hypothetical protein
MFCPECKAEYRPGFTRCADCDVELVENYVAAVRHPLAKKAVASEKYGTRLWSGNDPHFYMELLWDLWNKKVECYGAPEKPPVPKAMRRSQQFGSSDPGGFEVWVSEEDLPLAKWILDSAEEEFEKNPPEERTANKVERELSPGTTGICPLCFGEFATASSYCPNCGVPLRLPQPDRAVEDCSRLLCNIYHPKFIVDLRKALQAAGIPFNNANISSGDIISGRHMITNYDVVVLDQDFERATQVMSQVLQHWEFEPSAGFGFRNVTDPLADYWPEGATQNGWLPKDISALVWSSENIGPIGAIGLALQEHEIAYRVEAQPVGTVKVFTHAEDEARARELVREVVEGPPPE